MSDADIVSVFSRKMGAVERLIQRKHTQSDAHLAPGSEMKELHARIADLASQIKHEKYIEQLEAIESSTRSPLKVRMTARLNTEPTQTQPNSPSSFFHNFHRPIA